MLADLVELTRRQGQPGAKPPFHVNEAATKRLIWSASRLSLWSGTRGVLPHETPRGNSSGNWDSDPNYELLVRIVTFWAHARWAAPLGRWGTLTDFSLSSIFWEQ
jgi:hypothetical protein